MSSQNYLIDTNVFIGLEDNRQVGSMPRSYHGAFCLSQTLRLYWSKHNVSPLHHGKNAGYETQL